MNINIYNQLSNLIIFIFTGIAIGIIFDIFRILRKTFKTPDIITYLEDIIFWMVTGGILLFTIFTFNSGQIRSYVIVGILLGIFLYLLTISKLLIKVSIKILYPIKKILYFPFKIVQKVLNNFILKPLSKILSSTTLNVKSKILKISKFSNTSSTISNDNNINTNIEKCINKNDKYIHKKTFKIFSKKSKESKKRQKV